MGSLFIAFPQLVKDLAIEPRHIIHVGAHKGEEVPFYKQAGAGHITLVEPIPELAQALRDEHQYDSTIDVIEVACGAVDTTAVLTIMDKTNLSTLNEPQFSDRVDRQIRVPVVRMYTIQRNANVAVIDAQGLETDVLESADLSRFDLVIAECSTVHDPSIAADYDELESLMDARGFRPVNEWKRDYQFINRWSRGTKARHHRGHGLVLDVAYVKKSSSANM